MRERTIDQLPRDEHPEGVPWGTYDVFYHTVKRDGSIARTQGFDSNVSHDRLDRLQVDANEVAEAVCLSQPGGMRLYGSRRARAAWIDQHGEGW